MSGSFPRRRDWNVLMRSKIFTTEDAENHEGHGEVPPVTDPARLPRIMGRRA